MMMCRSYRRLAKYLSMERCSVRELDLTANDIGTVGASELSVALTVNSSLETLILANNDIGDIGFQDLTNALQFNSKLCSLSVSNCHVSDAGLEQLPLVSCRLRSLDLSCNRQLRLGGIVYLARFMTNNALQELTLDGVSLGVEEARIIATVLQESTSLVSLSLKKVRKEKN